MLRVARMMNVPFFPRGDVGRRDRGDVRRPRGGRSDPFRAVDLCPPPYCDVHARSCQQGEIRFMMTICVDFIEVDTSIMVPAPPSPPA